jgi:hypothetical protein
MMPRPRGLPGPGRRRAIAGTAAGTPVSRYWPGRGPIGSISGRLGSRPGRGSPPTGGPCSGRLVLQVGRLAACSTSGQKDQRVDSRRTGRESACGGTAPRVGCFRPAQPFQGKAARHHGNAQPAREAKFSRRAIRAGVYVHVLGLSGALKSDAWRDRIDAQTRKPCRPGPFPPTHGPLVRPRRQCAQGLALALCHLRSASTRTPWGVRPVPGCTGRQAGGRNCRDDGPGSPAAAATPMAPTHNVPPATPERGLCAGLPARVAGYALGSPAALATVRPAEYSPYTGPPRARHEPRGPHGEQARDLADTDHGDEVDVGELLKRSSSRRVRICVVRPCGHHDVLDEAGRSVLGAKASQAWRPLGLTIARGPCAPGWRTQSAG